MAHGPWLYGQLNEKHQHYIPLIQQLVSLFWGLWQEGNKVPFSSFLFSVLYHSPKPDKRIARKQAQILTGEIGKLDSGTRDERGRVCRGGWMPAPRRDSLSENVTTARHPCWFFQDANKAQFHWGVHVEQSAREWRLEWAQPILAGRVTGCGCPVIRSAWHRPSPLHQQESHHSGSIRTRPTGVIKSHSKALKASCLSRARFLWAFLWELPFPWPLGLRHHLSIERTLTHWISTTSLPGMQ